MNDIVLFYMELIWSHDVHVTDMPACLSALYSCTLNVWYVIWNEKYSKMESITKDGARSWKCISIWSFFNDRIERITHEFDERMHNICTHLAPKAKAEPNWGRNQVENESIIK